MPPTVNRSLLIYVTNEMGLERVNALVFVTAVPNTSTPERAPLPQCVNCAQIPNNALMTDK